MIFNDDLQSSADAAVWQEKLRRWHAQKANQRHSTVRRWADDAVSFPLLRSRSLASDGGESALSVETARELDRCLFDPIEQQLATRSASIAAAPSEHSASFPSAAVPNKGKLPRQFATEMAAAAAAAPSRPHSRSASRSSTPDVRPLQATARGPSPPTLPDHMSTTKRSATPTTRTTATTWEDPELDLGSSSRSATINQATLESRRRLLDQFFHNRSLHSSRHGGPSSLSRQPVSPHPYEGGGANAVETVTVPMQQDPYRDAHHRHQQQAEEGERGRRRQKQLELPPGGEAEKRFASLVERYEQVRGKSRARITRV